MGTHRVVYLYPWVLLRHGSQIKNAILTWCFDMCIYCETIEWSSFLFWGDFFGSTVLVEVGEGSCFSTRRWNPGFGGESTNHWTAREFPWVIQFWNQKDCIGDRKFWRTFCGISSLSEEQGHPPYKLSLILMVLVNSYFLCSFCTTCWIWIKVDFPSFNSLKFLFTSQKIGQLEKTTCSVKSLSQWWLFHSGMSGWGRRGNCRP